MRPDNSGHTSATHPTRREFLIVGGSIAAASLAVADEFDANHRPPTFVARIRRDFDLIELEMAFIGFRERDGHLVPYPGRGAAVAVHFPPQNLAEAAFTETHLSPGFEIDPVGTDPDPNANSPAPPVRSYISGTSRLVFEVPADARIPLRTRVAPPARAKAEPNPTGRCEELLTPGVIDSWFALLARWPLRLPSKMTRPKFHPHIPGIDETCLELPYRLLIAPRFAQTRWLTTSEKMPFDRAAPATTELWNAELISRTKLLPAKPGVDLGSQDPNLAPLQDITLQATAVYSPDYNKANPPTIGEYFPGNQPLSSRRYTRHLLVEQMADGNGWIDVDHLVLTALGSDSFLAYFNQKSFEQIFREQVEDYKKHGLPGAKVPKDPNDAKSSLELKETLAVWKHRMVVGRDVYIVEAMAGALFPMVHPAVHVTLTQRKFVSRSQPAGAGPPGAYLLRREYIVVRRPERTFTDSGNPLGRSMPTKSVVLGWTQTPDLVPISQCPINSDLLSPGALNTKSLVYVPRPVTQLNQTNEPNRGKPLRWPVTFTDESGRQARTDDACLLFAANVVVGHVAWQNLKPDYRRWSVPAQPLGLAPEKVYVEAPLAADAGIRPSAHELKPAELEGASRLGDALATWRSFDPGVTLAIPSVERNLPGWATFESLQRVIRPAWDEKAVRKFDEFVKGSLLTANGFVEGLATSYRDILKNVQSQINGDFEALVGKVKDGAAQLLVSMQRIEAASLQAVDRAVTVIQKLTGDKALAALREFDGLLSGAERVSAALETHSITFGSRLVERLYADDGVVKALAIVAPAQLISEAEKQLKDKFDKPEYAELKTAMEQELAALKSAANEQRKRLTEQYLNQLKDAQQRVGSIGSDLFHAVVEEVKGVIPSMKAIVPDYPPERIGMTADYLARGIRDVEQGIFAQVIRDAGQLATINQVLAKKVDSIKNGLATPRAMIQGLSTQLGAVAADGPEQLRKLALQKIDDITGGLDFKNAIPSAKLFGAIDLVQLIANLGAGHLPSINLVKTPELLQHTWKWTIPIRTGRIPFGILTWETEKSGEVALHIEVVTTARLPKPEEALAGKKPEGNARLDAYIGHYDIRRDQPTPPAPGSPSFKIELLGLIGVHVRQVRLGAQYALGASPTPSIKPEIAKIEFLGPMKFVETLQDMFAGLFGGLRPELSPAYLSLTLSFTIPPISFGFFSLRNITLGAGLMLPFGDDPLRFRFNFATFAKPFELTVLAFGGRGFLRTEIDTRGGRLLEGALEFGGSLAFDVGVASGGLYVMAGIYFRITQDQTTLSGYIRAGGNLNVLGLIHASVEFMLAMSYRSLQAGDRRRSELYGTATVTVSISLFMFSIDVSITMEKRIAGSEGPSGDELAPARLGADGYAPVAFRHGAAANEEGLGRPMPKPAGYFAQHGPREEFPGRFPWNNHRPYESARQWVDGYWSQFDFTKR